MGWFSFLQHREGARAHAGAVSSDRSGADALRVQARRRLVGAAVLVLIAVIGFPLVFETQPRPLRADVSIDVARRTAAVANTSAPLPIRPLDSPVTALAAERPEAASPVTATTTPVLPAASAGSSTAAPPAAGGSQSAEALRAAPTHTSPPALAEAADTSALPASHAAAASAAVQTARVPALADSRGREASGKPAEAAAQVAAGNRFVVQVGAFSEAIAVRDVRVRVEKLGLHTYTQDVATTAGKRTRVRVGPFAEREEADRTAAKLKAAGLAAAVLTL